MKSIIVALALVAAVAAEPQEDVLTQAGRALKFDADWPAFVTFAIQHKRNYPHAHEAAARFKNFKSTLARNVELRAANPLATFGVNKFSDLSADEFRAQYLMPVNSTGRFRDGLPKFWKHKHDIPAVKRDAQGQATDVDWCAEGYCTPVKNQEQCGSCWAFSATEVIESSMALAGQGLPVLAPQQIVDCDTAGQDQGCNGGDPRGALTYVAGAGGLDTESQYPYTGTQGASCNMQSPGTGQTTGPVDVGDGDENALQSFLQSQGPPSVCVDASSWSSYTGGVLTSCGCNIDHAVQATGISSQYGTPAYVIRNTWDTDWGVNGFIYLAIGSNTCCVANEVTWTTV